MRRYIFSLMAIALSTAVPCLVEAADLTEEMSTHQQHRHHVALFTGGTHVFSDNHTAVTYGIDYEYQLTPRIGVGALIERAEGAIDATSLIALVDIHITKRFVVQMGPGIEFEAGEEIAIGRIGAYYEFDLNEKITISPSVGYDISEEHDAIIFGLLIGKKF